MIDQLSKDGSSDLSWSSLSRIAGAGIGIRGRLFFFLVGCVSLVAPGFCMVLVLKTVAKLLKEQAESYEHILLFIDTFAE